ncbi:hypothetical protein [Sporosarcina sp. PTS2304]|uniref:hypothetical protein n=1 Tax=Sporosarcina sp. PTS2304 TaxID=2283194 RepID=UPI0013B3EA65|nr:hypothetical protein [Sporosarcina sp. PTS2304]
MKTIDKIQLMLHISQLRAHLDDRRHKLFKDLSFLQALEQCAEKMVHDNEGKVFYLYDVVCFEMLFKQVIIYYANDRICFTYNQCAVDISKKIIAKLESDRIHYVPLRKSFIAVK